MEHIETILELCQGRDCRLALNGIREFARPLTNVEITPVQGSFSERIQASQRNASEIARWKAEAAPILLSNQRPYRADLYGTLLRFGLFFSQNEEAEKTLILASKCVHTGPERLLPPFPEDVTILVVGAEHDTAKWVFGENVVTLDDMESALEILKLKARR